MNWFRSYHGAPTDPKWQVIARRSNTTPSIVIAVFWALLDHASQQEERGSIEGFDAESISLFLDIEEADIERIIAAMESKNVVSEMRLANWDKRQTEDSSTRRVQRHRARQKDAQSSETQCNVTETLRNTNETQCNVDRENREEKREREEEMLGSASHSTHPTSETEEEKPITTTKPVSKPSRGTRLPEDWTPSDELKAWARKEFPVVDLRISTDKFVDYWLSTPGAKGVKTNWDATYRNWIRSDAQSPRRPGTSSAAHSEPYVPNSPPVPDMDPVLEASMRAVLAEQAERRAIHEAKQEEKRRAEQEARVAAQSQRPIESPAPGERFDLGSLRAPRTNWKREEPEEPCYDDGSDPFSDDGEEYYDDEEDY